MPELLATVDELLTFLELDSGDVDSAKAELLLRIASDEVRAYTGRLFDEVLDDEVILAGKGAPSLILPDAPVTDVAEVLEAQGTDDELALDGPDAASPDYQWTEEGFLRRVDGNVFARNLRWYKVTYSHGYAELPADVLGVVLKVAGRALDTPEGGQKQETIGRYSYTAEGEAAGVGLLEADRNKLAYLRITGRSREGTPASGS